MTDVAPRPSQWDRWLLAVTGAVIAFSAMLVILRRPTEALFDGLVFGTQASPVQGADAEAYVSFVYGVLGAVMIGWMVALIGVIRGPLRRRERWAWTTIASSTSAWFVLDSTMSVVRGFPENAALNVVFVVAFAIPLAAMRAETQATPTT